MKCRKRMGSGLSVAVLGFQVPVVLPSCHLLSFTTLHSCNVWTGRRSTPRKIKYNCKLGHTKASEFNNEDPSNRVFELNGGAESNNGEAKFNDDTTEELQTLPASEIKDQLIQTLEVMINDSSQVDKVEKSIIQLESKKMTPVTKEFTELALAGTWNLLFSSLRPLVSDKIRIREITQRVDPETKQLTNGVVWSFPSKSNKMYIDAVLAVECSYEFVGPGRLDVKLQKHTIKIVDPKSVKDEMPDDMQAVVNQLRRALPIEHFDPSGLSDVSYIEPTFRICRFLGKRLAGVRNVFTRKTPE